MRMGREGREERGRIHHYNWIAHEDGQGGEEGGYWTHHCYWIAHEDGHGRGGGPDSPLLLDCA